MPQIIPAAATFIARELQALNGPFGLFVAEPLPTRERIVAWLMEAAVVRATREGWCMMKTSDWCCAFAIVAAAASSSAASPTLLSRGSVSPATRTQEHMVDAPAVPLRIQRLLKRRAPQAAYVPTRLPAGYTYFKHENVGRWGFDLYFTCCDDNLPLIGFDAVLVKRSEPCNQGSAEKTFRIDGVVVRWNAGHNEQQAWRCVRRSATRLLLTVSGEPPHSPGTSWRTPRQLARMVASARPIR
jgi:hypothetical protein